MPQFELVYEGTGREVYVVEAETEEQAREIWWTTDPVSSEVLGGAIVSAKESE